MADLSTNLERLSDARDDIAESIRGKGVTVGEYDGFEDFSSKIDSITNSYSVGDEGKVVNNGELISQTAVTKTSNGTYDTTLNNSVTVNVPFDGGKFRVTSVKCKPSITSNGYVIRTINTKTFTFNGNTKGLVGSAVWTDGTNIYLSWKYSSSIYYQCIYDKSTSTWTDVTWNISNIDGTCIWTDGDNIYYQPDKSPTSGYVLNKNTSTWSSKSWSGNSDSNFKATYIWTDGDSIYYSNSSKQYVLNKSTSTWETKTWTGTSPAGHNVWTDGNNIYYSGGSSTTHRVLNKSTSTWSTKTWNGLTNFYGADVWTDGSGIYYNSSTTEYVLDKSTSTWYGGTVAYSLSDGGSKIWSDGEHIYYSNGGSHYEIFTHSVQLNNTNGYNVPRMDVIY